MAKLPEPKGGIATTGRVALSGLRFGGKQLKRGLGIATAGILAPGISAIGSMAASPLGMVVGGAIGGVSSAFSNINKVLNAIVKQMDAREKAEQKLMVQQKKELNKQVVQDLEDQREGLDGPEDPKTGKGPITVRLGLILRRMRNKAKSAVGGLFSKIPGASFVRGAIGSGISRMAALGASTIIGWGLVIAGIALVLKFIADNIVDWVSAILDKIPIIGDIRKLLGKENLLKNREKRSKNEPITPEDEITKFRKNNATTFQYQQNEMRKNLAKISPKDRFNETPDSVRSGWLNAGRRPEIIDDLLNQLKKENHWLYKPKNRFAGGRVNPGESYWVGEGPDGIPGTADDMAELFTSDKSGKIHSSRSFAATAAPAIQQTSFTPKTASLSAPAPSPTRINSTTMGGENSIMVVRGGDTVNNNATASVAYALQQGNTNIRDRELNHA